MLGIVLDLAQEARNSGIYLMDLRPVSSHDTDASSSAFATLPFLVDCMLWLATQIPVVIDLALPSTCLETSVEASTNAECDGILSYLDSRIAEFKRPGVMPKSHHTLLRTCTLMLRRLSKSQDASLCGRVLLFLAKFLPLTERSGVNLSGAFHIENVTPVEDVPDGAVDAEGRPVDAEFYATFWGLQKWFSDPPSALRSGRWTEISKGILTVLDKFASEKVTVTENAHQKDISSAGGTSVKYLSSARLLPLQLRDAAFRRHFLLQALVLMAWVEHPLLKDWADKGAKGRTLEDLEELRNKVFETLESTPEKGKEFADAVRGVLSGEVAWATWKHAGCPPEPLQVAPLVPPPSAATIKVGRVRKRPRPSPDATFGTFVGNDELDRLWNLTEDNLSTLGADDRGGFKTLRQLMEPVIEEMNEEPDGTDEDQMKASKNSTYSWKTLRLLSRDSLPAFASAVRAGGDLTVAARALYPNEVPPAPEIEAGQVKMEVSSRPETPAVTAAVQTEGHAVKEEERKEELIGKGVDVPDHMETDAEKEEGVDDDGAMVAADTGGDSEGGAGGDSEVLSEEGGVGEEGEEDLRNDDGEDSEGVSQ